MPFALLITLAILLSAVPAEAQRAELLTYRATGRTVYGDWRADTDVSRDFWRPGDDLSVRIAVRFPDTQIAALAAANIKADKLCVLVTAERTFDASGWMRLSSDERMSTLLTPSGLAIEGGVQGAVTNRYGYAFRSPLDEFQSIPLAQVAAGDSPGTSIARFSISTKLPANLPPGLYRIRIDLGVMVGTRVYNFNGYSFASRPFSNEDGTNTYFYSQIIPASAPDPSGRQVDAARIQARFPWILLSNYNSNGYRGVVADEDRARFATSDRSLIPDEVILPMYDDNGNRLSYSLEPQFPVDTIDPLSNILWAWTSGELSIRIAGPDGSIVDLGKAPFVAKAGNGPTTKKSAFTGWRPQAYGRYTVTAAGWIEDANGRRYEGGGTYRFWIARRMTLATATFQGMPYPVGATYGRDIQFNPPLPADVQVTATLYVDSDPHDVRTISYSGRATSAGLFGAAQGMKSFPLSAPGEYHAQVLATATDADGHLWVSTMRHAGIVYPTGSTVLARGKKLAIGGKYVDRGETRDEGYIADDGTQHLNHLTFPYNSGDVLLIAAEGQGANKIEPVLIYQMQGDTSAWDTKLNGVGTTNLSIKTSNGYSPHLYPEYITDVEYYYGAAPRPGFMGRFLVAESNVRAPYWPVSPNSFGGQIGASANGDAPGDIYRLIGGVVLRRSAAKLYAGYISSAFLLPRGTNNNRVVAAGSEDVIGSTGERARFFLVGLRPGTAYEIGGTFRPAVQIDPLLPASIHFELAYPDGRRQTADGTADQYGSFAGPAAWPLDVTGIYKYRLTASWNGFQGRMPGLPESGGEFYVYPKSKPAGAAGLRIDGNAVRTFSAATGTTVTGTSSASTVHYALITPGAVIAQGEVPVKNGKFEFAFDPAGVHARVPLYDVVSITSGRPQIGRVVHLTFCAEEKAAGGATFFDIARVILRGTTMIAPRAGATASVSSQAAAPGAEREPTVEASAASPATVAGMIASGQLRIISREIDSLLPERVHERLQQFQGGIPVAGADLTRQTRDGQVVSVFGRVTAPVEVPDRSALDESDARALAERRTGGRVLDDEPPRLVVLPGREPALAWKVEARTGGDVILLFLDATTGRVLHEQSTLKTIDPRVVDMAGDTRRTAAVLAGESPIESGGGADAEATTAARANIETALAYMTSRFGRRGVEGRDGVPPTIVRPASARDWPRLGARYPHLFSMAFWDGRAIVLGAGAPSADGRGVMDTSAALDVTAHEIGHALVDASSRLEYRDEAGALHEAYADIFAAGVERFADPEHANGVIGRSLAGVSVRSLANPEAYGGADRYDRRDPRADDNGGVHANSTIASHAFWLAAERLPSERDRIEQVFYRAFAYLLPSQATFATAREATLQSARDLCGAGSAVERAIAEAWDAAGVGS